MKTSIRQTSLFLILVAILGVLGCGILSEEPLTEEEFSVLLTATEDSLYKNQDVNMDGTKAIELLEMYEKYANTYMENEKVPVILLRGGELAMSLKDTEKALSFFIRLCKAYPEYEKTPYALFLQGFIYENHMLKYGKAEEVYREFMSTYPKHELYKDAAFSIKNMGKTPEELLKEFEGAQEAS